MIRRKLGSSSLYLFKYLLRIELQSSVLELLQSEQNHHTNYKFTIRTLHHVDYMMIFIFLPQVSPFNTSLLMSHGVTIGDGFSHYTSAALDKELQSSEIVEELGGSDGWEWFTGTKGTGGRNKALS